MACKYWYDGAFRTEEEFKSILENGLIDQLLNDNIISLEKFELLDKSKIKNQKTEKLQQVPIDLRIARKIQTKLNQQKLTEKERLLSEDTSEQAQARQRNPLKVLEEAGLKASDFKIVIPINGELKTGEGRNNRELAKRIRTNFPELTLEDGIEYMLIESSDGLFPVRLFNNLVEKTDDFPVVKSLINDLEQATKNLESEKILNTRKELEDIFYRTQITFEKDEFVVKITNRSNTTTTSSFANKSDVIDFLGKQIRRTNYTRINKGNYNQMLADKKVLTTDLFAKDGNFFNSSSFILDAYQITDSDKEAYVKSINAVYEDGIVTVEGMETAKTSFEPNEKNQNQTSTKEEESKIFNTPVNKLKETAEEIRKEDVTDLAALQKQAAEKAALSIDTDATDNFGDLDIEGTGSGVETYEDPNVKTKIKVEDFPLFKKSNKEVEEEVKGMIGDALKRASANKGTLLTWKNFETLKRYLPAQTYRMLAEARKNGDELWGLFTGAGILMQQNAPVGVLYHEAFHVIFNLGLNLEERVELINQTYEKYKSDFLVKDDGAFPTFLEVEEYLADKFTEYKASEEDYDFEKTNIGTQSAKQKKAPIGKVKTFFKTLNRMSNVFFKKNNSVDINSIFQDIDTGHYANKIKFKNTILDASVRQASSSSVRKTSPDKKYSNPEEEAQSFTYFYARLQSQLELARNEHDPSNSLTNSELIEKIGVHNLFSFMLTDVYLEAKTYQKNNEKNKADVLFKFLNVLTNNSDVTSVTNIGERKVLQFNKSTDLLERFIRNIQEKGIYISYRGKGVEESIQDASDNETLSENNILDSYENGETTSDRVAMQSNIEINPRQSISEKLKEFFATIPLYNKEGQKVINSFGVNEFQNPSKVFSELIGLISNSYTMATMEEKINNLNKPYKRFIQDKLAKDPVFKKQLWASIGSKNFATYTTVYEKNGEYQVFNSNRKTVDNIIKEDLISNFLNPQNIIFDSTGKLDYEKIDLDAAETLKDELNLSIGEFTTINKDGSRTSRETILEEFETLGEIFKDYGINISPKDLENILNVDENVTNFTGTLDPILSLLNTLQKISKELVEGNNPFTSLIPQEIAEEDKVNHKKRKSLLAELGTKLIPAMDQEIVSSYRNIEGKTAYNLILSGQLNKMVSQFTNPDSLSQYAELVEGDGLISNLPLLKDLQNPESDLQENFKVVLLDGLTRKGKKQAVTYSNMSDIEIEATNMAMFHNNGALKKVFYKLPIPSDSPTIGYLQAEKYSKEEIVDKLIETAKGEISRIQKLKLLIEEFNKETEEGKQNPKYDTIKIPNYANRGSKFQILSFLNKESINTNLPISEEILREEIENFLDPSLSSPFFSTQIKKYLKSGVITSVNKEKNTIEFASGVIDSSIKNPTDFFKQYLVNSFYTNTQTTTLFGGDPSFYKNTTDYQKRYKQIFSPGTYTSGEGNYNAVILNDSLIPTSKANLDNIKSLINSDPKLTKEDKKVIISTWENAAKKGNNESDAGTYVSLERRKKIMDDLGQWTNKHEEAYKRIKRGVETFDDVVLIQPPFKPEKPFVFTKRIVNGIEIPIQIKNAETVLTKSFALKEDSNGNLMYPQLAAIYNDMEAGKYDTAIFESAIKVGSIGNSINLADNKTNFSTYNKQADGTYKLDDNVQILSLKEEDYRIQQETPKHYLDDRSNFGTQLRNLIIADINKEGTYTVDGKNMSGEATSQMFQELVANDLEESYNNLEKMFLNSDGSINYNNLVPMLREQAIEREMGQEYLDALAPVVITETGGSTKQISPTTLPLYHPKIANQTEALLNSIFRNRITKQKIQGGQLVNTPSYGVSNELKMEVDNNGTITLEAYIPATSTKFPIDPKTGEVDFKFLEKNASELLEIIANRIPTEDKYSIFNIKIKGFTPPSMGGTIILPPEATTIAGLDFDIDKLFFMQKAFYMDKQGNPKVIQYIDKATTEKEASDLASIVYSSINTYKRFLNITESKENVRNKKIEDYKKQLKESAKRQKDSNKFPQQIEAIDNFLQALTEQEEEFDFTVAEQFYSEEQFKELDAIEEFLKTQNTDTIAKLNSKKARDNKKISIIQGILKNKHTSSSILNVGDFSSLSNRAKKVQLLQAGYTRQEVNKLNSDQLSKEIENLEEKDFNINYPSTQLELFRRNMDGGDLIGIFANHNVHHAKSQFANVYLKDAIKVNGREYQSLSNIYSPSSGERISRALATNLAAVVDNAKDPIASFLNMNTFTANSIALLERLGVEGDFVDALLNQPVILELTKNYFNDQGNLTEVKQFTEIKKVWKQKLTDKLKEANKDTENLKNISLTTEMLQDNLASKGTIEYYEVQAAALNFFENIYDIGRELGLGIQASKTDTAGTAATAAANYVFINKQQKILDGDKTININGQDVEVSTNKIKGLDQIFLNKVSTQKMIPAFTQYGLYGPINILNKIFSSIGSINNQGDITYSALGELKQEFSNNIKPNGILTEREASMIDTQFINFIGNRFPFFNKSQSKNIIENLPNKLDSFRKGLPENSPYIYMLNQLYTVEANAYSPIKRIEYYNTGKSNIDKQRFTNVWERMLLDKDPNVQQFAKDLVKYTFFTGGYSFGPFSFANLIPVTFWSDSYQVTQKDLYVSDMTFNQFIQKLFSDNGRILKESENKWMARFKDQFIGNFGNREGFAPTIVIDSKQPTLTELGYENIYEKQQVIITAAQKQGAIKTAENRIIVNRKSNPTVKEYIKVFKKPKLSQFGNIIPQVHEVEYYKLNPKTDYSELNPAEFGLYGSESINVSVYERIPALGIPNFLTEFDYNADIKNSVLSEIEMTSKVDKVPVSTTVDKIVSDPTNEEKSEIGVDVDKPKTTVPPKVVEKTPETIAKADEQTKKMLSMFAKEDVPVAVPTYSEVKNAYDKAKKAGKTVDDLFSPEVYDILPPQEKQRILRQIENC